jgi:hypothetical protein
MKNDLFGYIKLGRLDKRIADKINRKAADICIDYNHLRHIENGKGDFLDKIKLDALSYVKKIVDNFTEIRKGKNGALLLVAAIEENNHKNIAVIELQLLQKYSFYMVKTAMARRRGMVENEIILWQKNKKND